MNIKRAIMLRVRLAFLAVAVFSTAIAVRIFYIQQVEGSMWRKKANKTYVKNRTIVATRGSIYADDGSLLATSLPYYRLGLDLTVGRRKGNDALFNAKIDSVCILLSRFFGDHSKREYQARILAAHRDSSVKYIVLNNETFDFQQKKRIENWPLFRLGKYKGGAVFEVIRQRVNPFGNMGKRTIGSTNDNRGQVGISGLEASFNGPLGGRSGKGVFEQLAGGSWRALYDGSETKPVPGLDLYTTLNVNMQDVAESALLRALRQYRADYGCVVVMEVATGEIKAMTNLKLKHDSTYTDDFNFAVRWATNPGSTFKLPTMVALFEEAALSPTDLVNTGNGVMMIHGRRLEDSNANRGGHGTISIQHVFESSSNIGTVKMVLRHFAAKPERYLDYLDKFHLTKPLNFQFRGEAKPFFRRPGDRRWSKTSLPWTSIGYESLLTPLQILTFYNSIANNGYWVQPLIVKRTQRADEVQEDFTKTQVRPEKPICSERTLKIVRSMLEGVVQHGGAVNIKGTHYQIAGKTGTSQKLINGTYRKGVYYTSFAGYFPANQPKYSCIVVIDNPHAVNRELLYARAVAAPVFRDIADKIYATDLRLHRELQGNTTRPAFPAQKLKTTHTSDARLIAAELNAEAPEGWTETQTPRNQIPDLRGMTLRDALYVLENKQYRVSYSGVGKVVSQQTTGRLVTLKLE
ncbi:MAG: cell division protein [Cytophagaceae bacterium]|nr:cell division protein [Cytophagaceae bacterium]